MLMSKRGVKANSCQLPQLVERFGAEVLAVIESTRGRPCASDFSRLRMAVI
jgi:hypothetical protein